MSSVEILLIISIVIQLFATGIAVYLTNQTKYIALWICCVIALAMLSVERVLQLCIFDGTSISPYLQAWIGIIASISISVSVICARFLVNYVERMTAQRRLFENKLMSAVLRTEERSRAEFSRELHDGLGPLLSSAKMSISTLSTDNMNDRDRETLRNTAQVIDEAIRSLREISNNLSPHVLNNFGLARGIKQFVDRLGTTRDTNILFTTTIGGERFDSNIEVILYRVVCELVNNSLKHSACDRIVLELNKVGKNIVIDYRDNGKGFNLEEVESVGMGLSNIKSRISSLGGKIRFDSKPGSGMLAHIEVSTTGEIVQLAEDLYEQVYGKRYGRKKSKRSVGR
jgi:signal transduction histidine kinase